MKKLSKKVLGDLLWKNPILRMQMRQRLRPRALIIWGLITFIPCLFIFLNVYNSASFSPYEDSGEARILALKATFIPMLIAQGIILMFLGTGSVAGGMAEEKESGLLDYQRLTPMSPMAKIVGYLLGLPCREYLLLALTLPFTLISAIGGQLPLGKVILLYTIFLCVALVYHLTAMVAGMLARKPRKASWFARIMVVLLNVFLPALSQMGLTVFGHITIMPTLWGLMHSELGKDIDEEFLKLWEVVPFFSWELPPALFSFVVLGFLMVIFLFILLRKWQQDSNHSLTKRFALFVFAVLQFLMIGSLLPHLSKEMDTYLFLKEMFPLNDGLAGAILFLHLVLSLATTILLIHLVTPLRHTLAKGIRRIRKLNMAKVPSNWDAAGSLPTTLGFIGMATVVHILLLASVIQETDNGIQAQAYQLAMPITLFAFMAFYTHAARTIWPTAGFFGFLALLWILPELTGLTLAAFTQKEEPLLYFGVTNPIHASFYTISISFKELTSFFGREVRTGVGEQLSTVTFLSLAFHGGLAVLFLAMATKWKRSLQMNAANIETRKK
ncbi:MAG: hypothetical protein HOK49_04525 [Opitutae bacterium]|nr:hypothetical protein [Opitutae bacterium]